MSALLQEMFAWPNLLFSILLSVVIIYWLSVIFGALNLEFLDLDLDGHTELGIDGPHGHDHDLDVHPGGAIHGVLAFLNAGKVPLMIVISFFVLSLWSFSIFYNYYLGGLGFWVPLALLIPNVLVSTFVTKAITTPLVPIFKSFYEDQRPVEIAGNPGTVLLGWETGKFGLAKVTIGNKSLEVRVRGLDGQPLRKGQRVVLVRPSETDAERAMNVYLALPVE